MNHLVNPALSTANTNTTATGGTLAGDDTGGPPGDKQMDQSSKIIKGNNTGSEPKTGIQLGSKGNPDDTFDTNSITAGGAQADISAFGANTREAHEDHDPMAAPAAVLGQTPANTGGMPQAIA